MRPRLPAPAAPSIATDSSFPFGETRTCYVTFRKLALKSQKPWCPFPPPAQGSLMPKPSAVFTHYPIRAFGHLIKRALSPDRLAVIDDCPIAHFLVFWGARAWEKITRILAQIASAVHLERVHVRATAGKSCTRDQRGRHIQCSSAEAQQRAWSEARPPTVLQRAYTTMPPAQTWRPYSTKTW